MGIIVYCFTAFTQKTDVSMWSPYGKFNYNEYKDYKMKLNSAL